MTHPEVMFENQKMVDHVFHPLIGDIRPVIPGLKKLMLTAPFPDPSYGSSLSIIIHITSKINRYVSSSKGRFRIYGLGAGGF